MLPIVQPNKLESLFKELNLRICGYSVASYFRQYAETFSKLKTIGEQIDNFASLLVLQNMGASAKVFPFQIPNTTMAEIAIKPKDQIWPALMEGLQQGINALREKVIVTLDDLVAQKQVGSIQWLSQTVCRFSYFTATHRDTFLREYRNGNQLIKEKERTHIHLMHIHDVMDANSIPLPANTVKMPERVRTLIQNFPAPLFQYGKVVVGNEIARQTMEVDRAKEIVTETQIIEPVYRNDPALILGHYVLAGWEVGEE